MRIKPRRQRTHLSTQPANASQPASSATQRVTRSIGRREPEQVLEVPGPGYFPKRRQPHPASCRDSPGNIAPFATVNAPANASPARQDHSTFTAEAQGSSTAPQSETDLVDRPIESVDVDDANSSINWDFVKESIEPHEDLEAFYKRVGYLPHFNDDIIEALMSILPEGMDVEGATGRVNPSDFFSFSQGLEWRNVALEPDSEHEDPQLEKIRELSSYTRPTMETRDSLDASEAKGSRLGYPLEDAVAKAILMQYHETLWAADMKKCKDQGQEAIFQRTVMISMIDRLNLIYRQQDGSITSPFDFSVETPWTCAPMPTKAGRFGARWLTVPRPDLTLAFARKNLRTSQDFDWDVFPPPTKQLICYEGFESSRSVRAFPFLTIEAKIQYSDVDNLTARNQSLNNASQALHNMYEIFREADEGSGSHAFRSMFFDEVRFFSVVATPQGMRVRVHRARNVESPGSPKPVADGYPLHFTYTDYLDIVGKEYTYHKVAEELRNIVTGYVAIVLQGSLEKALEKVHEKFAKHERETKRFLQRDEKYYSYGQVPGSRKRKTSTPAPTSVAISATSMLPPSQPLQGINRLYLHGRANSPTSMRSVSQSPARSLTPHDMEDLDRYGKRMKSI